jgi:hypothetical protein
MPGRAVVNRRERGRGALDLDARHSGTIERGLEQVADLMSSATKSCALSDLRAV